MDSSSTTSLLDRELLKGRLTEFILEVLSRVQIFLSSTFEDTKFEQDFMLEHIFPFLREEVCRPLSLDFDVVTMRWGVNGKSGDTHKTSELCMKQLEDCKKNSISVAYATFQGQRYENYFILFVF